ncbi:MAG: hypothetical protein EBZ49_00735 [Proteobacteria bacterium]|nr:hypothetical protein [Pseudomonadota bacterium]
MNIKTNAPVRGSFGIPPEMQEAMNKKQEKKEPVSAPIPPAAEEVAPKEPIPKEAITNASVDDSDPIRILERLGGKFDNDDFQKLLFKGYYETELDVVKGRFRATFRTLTGAEYDEVDELLALEVKNTEMTNDGFMARRSMLIISYGVTHLMGKPVAKPVLTSDKVVDTKATALERRKALSALAPAITNKLIQTHGTITVAMNQIVENPDKYIKNS